MFSPRPAHRNSEPADAGIHWGFGLAVGAAYGAVAEYFPAATSKDGAGFGMVLGSLTGEAAPPAPGAVEQDNQAGEITSYVAYGVTTEFVRSFVRKRL
jgi:putative membrane protein